MKILLIQFGVSFLAVFLKGFQHQNVIGGKFKSAFIISYIMAVFEVAVITLMVKTGWLSIIPVGTGAAIGIVLSMYIYRKFDNKKDKL